MTNGYKKWQDIPMVPAKFWLKSAKNHPYRIASRWGKTVKETRFVMIHPSLTSVARVFPKGMGKYGTDWYAKPFIDLNED